MPSNPTTPALLLTELIEGQAGAETLFNGDIAKLDVFVSLRIEDRDLNDADAATATNGKAYLVAATPASGDAWFGKTGQIAYYSNGWNFVPVFEGLVLWVKDENVFLVYDGSNWLEIQKKTGENQTWQIRLNNPALNDTIGLWYSNKAITITEVRSVRSGGTSVTWNIKHASDRSAAGTDVFTADQVTTSTTTGDVDNSGFNDNTIAASNFVWFKVTAVSGSVTWIELTITFDAD